MSSFVTQSNRTDSTFHSVSRSTQLYDYVRQRQSEMSSKRRTSQDVSVFPERFREPTGDIVISAEIMSKIGLPALTQETYMQIMTHSLRSSPICEVKNVTLRENIVNTHDTDTDYDPIESFTDSNGIIYEMGNFLGKGSYGVVYGLRSHPERVVKIMHGDKIEDDPDLLLETIIQLLVSEKLQELQTCLMSSNMFEGYYAKSAGVYSLNYFTNAENRYLLLVMDAAQTPFDRYLLSFKGTPLQRSVINAHVTYQVSNTLMYLTRYLGFNHRDLKVDNIMVTETTHENSNGIRMLQVTLIDFGMSRLEYNGRLFSSNWRNIMKKLENDIFANPAQDITFFIISLLWDSGCNLSIQRDNCQNNIEPELYNKLITIITSTSTKIQQKYQSGMYEGNTLSGNPRWWELYNDVFEIVNNTIGFNKVTNQYDMDVLICAKKQMAEFLKSVAHGVGAPYYFGSRRI